ncbi:MAG TPA: asparagine synthase (glutamine-hydrolyzing) [Flavisolibacter sp.]|nr:asparagine synthase (glutamine-hydrolyzing) [Flavisolibacter sp.]
MCGIAGIISGTGHHLQRLKSATHVLQHRGPEGEGFFTNEGATALLGHRRLCIIDLSPAAKQPMNYADRYTIVYNGELYNYIELKAELVQKGFGFTSSSDTEVVIASYAAYGEDCLQRFDGAFSFAIWDEEAQVFFAARDRFGEKPFYFSRNGDELFFASEMKALWAGGVPRIVNERMMYNFLTIGYTVNPFDPAETFFEGIYKLPPGSFLTFSLASKEVNVEKYWTLQPAVVDIGEDEAVERFSHLLSASVQRRLRSDVSIGTSLSGGLDSSAIVAYCHGTGNAQYSHQCFTAAFPGYEKDERPFASAVAAKFDLKHHVVEIRATEIPELMAEAMRHQEEPIGSASALAQFEVYKAAKAHGVTVLLDGQGADEILGGYHKYYQWYWQELYRNDRAGWRREQDAAKSLGLSQVLGLKGKGAALFPHLAFALQQGRMKSSAYRSPDLQRDFASRNKESLYYSLPLEGSLNSALYFNTVNHGLEDLLRLADRNSMASSVEVRLPFLNHELVEFLFTLPAHFKIRNGWTKWLLRKTVESKLPEEIVWRKDKVGFEPPQKNWMQNSEVAQSIREGKGLLAEKGILDQKVLTQKLKPHDAHAAQSQDWKYWAASYLYR